MEHSRRAAPPRPSLLVGDLEGCHAAYMALQEEVLRLQLAEVDLSGITSDSSAWEGLVPRCRAIRETLTSVHELSDFTRQVYETSADICLRAGDHGEALKCLRQLVELIYASLAAARLQADRASRGSPHIAPPPGLAPRSASAAQQQCGGRGSEGGMESVLDMPVLSRWPEMAAALLLYYKCQQRELGEGNLDTVITLRRMPRELLTRPEVQQSLRLAAALGAGDYVAFFRQLASAPRAVQLTVRPRLPQVRQQALTRIAAAYRNIELAAAARMLGASGPGASRAVLAVLKAVSDRGHAAAQVALGNVQTSDDPITLVFR